MANRRLTMNRTREILRLRWEQGQGVRATGRAVGVGRSAVSDTCARAAAAGLDWDAVRQLVSVISGSRAKTVKSAGRDQNRAVLRDR